ncbi:BspA family leucine-rich repeat surface protein, partial [Catellicoccus marimammalium]
ADSKVKVAKEWNTYSDHFYTKKAKLADYKGKTLTAKYVYTYGNGKKYASLYDGDTWVGYANVEALDVVAEDKPTNPEKPEAKPDKPTEPGKPEKPDTKPDQPTDKPDQGGDNKPGTGGDKPTEPGKPENPDQGGSGSGDTDNKPGTGGGETDKPGQPDQPTDPSEPEKPKPETPKPSEEEVKSLEDAVEKAKKVVAAEKNLDGVEPVKKALEKAEKILADKDKSTKEQVVNATKEIEAAIKGITLKPSVNKESIIALHNAIEQLKETQKLGAGNLVNNEDYQKVLDEAQKVLDEAVLGKADKAKIDAETKKVNDFINGLKLNTDALNKKIEAVKEKGDKVYMTKTQEDEFNKFIEDAKTAAENKDLSNTDKLKEIDAQLKKAEEFIKGQPTEADVKELIKATEKEQEVVGKLKGKENDIFENWNTVEEKDKVADKMLENIKKDTASKNDATEKYTAEQVKNTAKELMDSMANLEVNHTNLQKYDKAAKDAIKDLDEVHQEEAEKLLRNFEVEVDNANAKNLIKMIDAAKTLNEKIHKDQVQEINDVIEKAKRIEGVNRSKEDGQSAPNAKFYESDSYEAMNNALDAAEKAEQKLDGESVKRSKRSVGATQVQNGKDAAVKENELKEKIKELKVKDWTVSEDKDGIIKLTKYTGDYTSTAGLTKKDGEQVIEIPGSLKDKQVVVESTKGNQLFNGTSDTGKGNAEVKFETATDGRKPKTGADFSYAFADNKQIGTVDVTELDTKDMTKMENTFMNDFYLSEIKGSEKLVHKGVTSLKAAFAGTNLHTLNASGWDTEGVTNMRAMFKGSNITTVEGMKGWDTSKVTDFNYMFGATKFKTLDLSKWPMPSNVLNENGIKAMFCSSTSKGGTKAEVTEVTLPDVDKGNPEFVVRALEAAGKNAQLAKEVTVKAAVDSTIPEKIGTVDTFGKWTAEKKFQKGDTLTTDNYELTNPAALCRVVMDSKAEGDNAESAKQLAQLLDEVAYPVWTYSTGHKVIKSRGGEVLIDSEIDDENNQGLVNDGGWSSFEKLGSGHYYKAMELLQKYARNTNSVTKDQFENTIKQLVADFKGMKVITTDLEKLVKEVEENKSETKQEITLVKSANEYIKDPSLANWKNIVETTKELREALADKK